MAEPDEDLVAEAEDSELEEEAEAELEAADSEAEVGAAEVLAGAEEAAEEPEPTLAQKVWTAGRTWSVRNGQVSKGSPDKRVRGRVGFCILRATSWPQALRTQPVARLVNASMRPQTQAESVAWHLPSWAMASVRQVLAHSGMVDRS